MPVLRHVVHILAFAAVVLCSIWITLHRWRPNSAILRTVSGILDGFVRKPCCHQFRGRPGGTAIALVWASGIFRRRAAWLLVFMSGAAAISLIFEVAPFCRPMFQLC